MPEENIAPPVSPVPSDPAAPATESILPVSQASSSKHSLTWLWVVMALVLIIALVAGGYLLMSAKPTAKPNSSGETNLTNKEASSEVSVSPTDNRLFTNTKYGYKFRIPIGYVAKESETGNIILSHSDPKNVDEFEINIYLSEVNAEKLKSSLDVGQCGPVNTEYKGEQAIIMCKKIKESTPFTNNFGIKGYKNILNRTGYIEVNNKVFAEEDYLVILLDVSNNLSGVKSVVINPNAGGSQKENQDILDIANSLRF